MCYLHDFRVNDKGSANNRLPCPVLRCQNGTKYSTCVFTLSQIVPALKPMDWTMQETHIQFKRVAYTDGVVTAYQWEKLEPQQCK